MWVQCMPYLACCSIWLKFLVIYLRVIVLIFGELHENRHKEGRTSFMTVSEIQFTCVPLNGSMTFWNYETPEYNLQTASNLQPFCDYRNGNTTKPNPNFRIKRFTVECGFHLLLEVTDNLVPLYSWEQRAGVRIVVDMKTCPWELSVKWQHECETCYVCVCGFNWWFPGYFWTIWEHLGHFHRGNWWIHKGLQTYSQSTANKMQRFTVYLFL